MLSFYVDCLFLRCLLLSQSLGWSFRCICFEYIFLSVFVSFVNGHTTEELLDVYVPNLQLLPFCDEVERSASAQIQMHYFCFLGILPCFPPPFNSTLYIFMRAHRVYDDVSWRRPNLLHFIFCGAAWLRCVFSFCSARSLLPYLALILKCSECIIWAFHWISSPALFVFCIWFFFSFSLLFVIIITLTLANNFFGIFQCYRWM